MSNEQDTPLPTVDTSAFVERRHFHRLDIRVSLLEQQNLMTTKQLSEINDNIKWLVRIVLGGVISAVLIVLFNGTGGLA